MELDGAGRVRVEVERSWSGGLLALSLEERLHLGAEGLDRRGHLDALHLAVRGGLLAALLVLSEEDVGSSPRNLLLAGPGAQRP